MLLEYTLGKEESFLFAITRHDYLLARLPAASQLSSRIRAFREAVAAGQAGQVCRTTGWPDSLCTRTSCVRPTGWLPEGKS